MIAVREERADGIASRKCWAEGVECERNGVFKSRADTPQQAQARLAGIRRQSWLSVAFRTSPANLRLRSASRRWVVMSSLCTAVR